MREPSSEVEGVEGDPDVLGGATRRGGSGGVEAEAEAGQGAAAGIYPVDILEDDPEGYQEAALAYYTSLGKGARTSPEIFSLPTGEQVKLEASSVCFCTMYRDEPQHKILVLVNPQVTKTVVAVYIKKSWWFTEEVLRTSDPVREGLLKVQSFGERIVLFVLNVIIFGRLERNLDDDDMFFLPHSVKEQAKILWRRGAAVGFYTTKMTVCRRFLRAWPEERGRLWEVETPGAWGQRSNIWLKVQLQQAGLPDSYPGNSKEEEVGVNGHGQTSQGNRPRQSANGEGNKERTCGEELESSNNGQDLGVKEEEAGLPERACWAELEVQEAKRTAEEAGLDGDPWHKLPQPSP
ncbi:uncharacterized protein LOC128579727 isoform X5 [Nycticebus coucang]|uniref:uncharacterized protein LOC128579727 isoform X5 n=1 Tax=Nycticebus coucang TaxID=9470 RepID=UPI00234D70E3|nr:uncharacterized protein LOC128579727 isoform X5 [Nycticebus coucang]